MSEELKKSIITVAEILDQGDKVKVKDEKGLTYSFFKKKFKDGTTSKAYELVENGTVAKGKKVCAHYEENPVPGSSGKYRNVRFWSDAESIENQPQNLSTAKTHSEPLTKETDWDAVNRGKTKSIFVVAAIRAGWSNEDMLKKLPELVDFCFEEQKETVPVKEEPQDIPF